ncbi:putative holin-like toxin [Streptococcus suis]|nr:putative holin-like toxin [Streptococcus suis]NQM27010.1 putative holin-like toxin [Streptococcus suis]NQO32627.1 putative holin-like toxin [Streptococcus suis]NQO42937.1 putative holin-like toxin [Streptococcus suis]NQO53567.1 putative holin-like toxin [Streptococcus suis]
MFEVVQSLLSFGGFTIALIGLCYKIFKDDDQKKWPSILWLVTAISE